MNLLSCLAACIPMMAAGARADSLVFSDNFESGALNWSFDAPWHLLTLPSACTATVPSGARCMYFGFDATCTFENTPLDGRRLQLLQPIFIPPGSNCVLEYHSRSVAEDNNIYDLRFVQVSPGGGPTWINLHQVFNSDWSTNSLDLSAYAGQSIYLRFSFEAMDSASNDTLGWMIDDVAVWNLDPYPLYCFGDGSAAACPCGNSSAPGANAGCLNSTGAPGSVRGFGAARISSDSLTLVASGLPPSSALFYQGGSLLAGGQGVAFGDGIKCTGAPILRLATKTPAGGSAQYPLESHADIPISVRAGITTPGTRYYQVYYRNPAAFCTPATFNYTNGVAVTWQL